MATVHLLLGPRSDLMDMWRFWWEYVQPFLSQHCDVTGRKGNGLRCGCLGRPQLEEMTTITTLTDDANTLKTKARE